MNVQEAAEVEGRGLEVLHDVVGLNGVTRVLVVREERLERRATIVCDLLDAVDPLAERARKVSQLVSLVRLTFWTTPSSRARP